MALLASADVRGAIGDSKPLMKVLHITTGLGDGGAEGVLYRLCRHATWRASVISLTDDGRYGPLLRQLGVEVQSMHMKAGRVPLIALHRLSSLIRQEQPDVVQCWMYHANLLGGVSARLAGIHNIAWCIRNSDLSKETTPVSTRLVNHLSAVLSNSIPRAIISCAESAAEMHVALGYDRSKVVLVPNGYDLRVLAPRANDAACFRQKLAIPKDAYVIGMAARWHPQKDHITLLDALTEVRRVVPSVFCLLAGDGVDPDNNTLMRYLQERELTDRVRLLGAQADISAFMSALDVHALSSAFGEAFPNVVAEAMACQVPCVVTEVGDAKAIVAATGWSVPKQDASALALALCAAFTEQRLQPSRWQERKESCRTRISEHYSIDQMVAAFESHWARVSTTNLAHTVGTTS